MPCNKTTSALALALTAAMSLGAGSALAMVPQIQITDEYGVTFEITSKGHKYNFRRPNPEPSMAQKPILFGQIAVSPNFSSKGFFKGASIAAVAAKLKTGELKAENFKVMWAWVNGERVVLNNRSLTTLSQAGLRPVTTVDMTGALPNRPGSKDDPDTLPALVERLDEMNGKPSKCMKVRKGDERRNDRDYIAEIICLPGVSKTTDDLPQTKTKPKAKKGPKEAPF